MGLPRTIDDAVDHMLALLSPIERARLAGTVEGDLASLCPDIAMTIQKALDLWNNRELVQACGVKRVGDASHQIMLAVWGRLLDAR